MVRIAQLVVRLLWVVITAALPVLLFLASRGLVDVTPATLVELAVGQGVCTCAESTRGLVQAWRRPAQLQLRAELSRVLQQGAFHIAERSGVDVETIGLSVFRLPGRFSRSETLKQVIRHRFDDHPGPSHIRWTKGKGIVGMCWQDQAPVYRDLRKLAFQARRQGADKIALTPAVKRVMGTMSRAEFDRIIVKYGEVYAEPIDNAANQMIGVLVVDIPFAPPVSGGTRLDVPAVEQVIANVAVLAGKLMS